MARRRRSTAEDVIDIVSRFPWWAGLTLALVSYVILHNIAGTEIAKPTDLNNVGNLMGKQLYVSLASFGQYVIPSICVFGAIISFFRRSRQNRQYEYVRSEPHQGALFDVEWQGFEGLVDEYFRRRGYGVIRNGRSGPDGGVDLVVRKGMDLYLVQCKQWKNKVGVQVVRELYGVVAAQGAAGGFVITAGEFSGEARKFAEGLNIQLIEGGYLHKMMRDDEQEASNEPVDTPQTFNIDPVCTKCGQVMVIRVAKKGRLAGKEFWGCSGFPGCRQTMSC